jgi:THAP4-like, heme-binding beta-barrel domain
MSTTTRSQCRARMVELRRVVMTAAVICLSSSTGTPAQPPPAADPFAAVSFLVGRWEGTSEGQPGTGTLRREYERALGGRFIRIHNRSEYPAQARNPKGEIHEDEGYLSFDRARRRLVLRQFHVEGFVNQYVQEDGATADRVVFTTESIENIPAGWRARETYVLQGPDAFEEIFELAEAGKPFEVYSRARLRRVK